MPFKANPNIREVRKSACVLYDRLSGQIRHMHLTVVLEGGHDPSESEVEEMAHAALHRRGELHAHLAALHVEHEAVAHSARYRVDVESKRLLKEEHQHIK
jgi:hypothetical protein